jgi:ureidoglycolate lyase
MKLLRFGPKGREKPGLLDSEGKIRDLSDVVSDIAGDVLTDAGLATVRAIDPASLPLVQGDPRIGPCVGNIGKFVCIGLNYVDHALESNLPVPAEPIVFNKWTSAVCGPNDGVEIPRGAKKTDWEVELGVVIGKPCKYVDEAHALDHVAGYCVINDLSEREWQTERGGTWDKGKGCDTFGPVGPWLVTKDEVPDPQTLSMWLDVNGQRMQTGNTKTMIFGVVDIVSYMSRFMTLLPGDIITTGTPPGVGMGKQPPIFLKPWDVMALGIDGLGEQRQEVIAWRSVAEG